MSIWAITEIEHPGLAGVCDDCPDCLDLARDAAIHARATGAREWFDAKTMPDGSIHRVHVQRAYGLVTL